MTILSIGDLNADITVTTDGPIAAGGDTPGNISLVAGGSAANVAAGVARLGVDTRFVGVVGDDLLGRFLVDELGGHGVDVRAVGRPAQGSRAIAALIDTDGDRSMVSDLTTHTVLRVDDIDPTWFDGATWLHLTAYTWFADGGPEMWRALRDLADDAGVGWSVDPSSAQMLERVRSLDDARRDFAGADVLFPNEAEAMALTGTDDIERAAVALLDLAGTVAVTTGPQGAVVVSRGTTPRSFPAHDVAVVNTLGAGDAFVAGFLAARLAGGEDERCAHAGLASAARVVTAPTAH